MTTANKVAAVLVALAAVVFGLIPLYVGYGAQAAGSICDAKSLWTMSLDAERTGRQQDADYLRQWAKKCDDIQLAGLAPQAGATSASTTTPTASASASPTASATASASASPTTTAPAVSIEEFLANRPVKTKTSTNAFGPMRAVLPSLDNKEMEKLTADEAKAELLYVVESVDRMQTSHKALDLGIVAKNGDKNQVNELTKRFVNDRPYWDMIRKQVADHIRGLKPSIVTVKADTTVGMAYSSPGKIPQVGTTRVRFGYATKWLVLKDASGKVVAKYRLACHFQSGGAYIQSVPATPRGTTITPEGETEVLINVCRLVNGEWINLRNVEHKQGDLPLNDAKCKSMSPSPSGTPTPSESPSGTPTPTPTPTPSDSTTPTPSCGDKTCETPTAAPTDRPAPTTSPSRSPETQAPRSPSQPARTPTPTLSAPGATKAPTPTQPVPSVTQSQPAEGDIRPKPRPSATESP